MTENNKISQKSKGGEMEKNFEIVEAEIVDKKMKNVTDVTVAKKKKTNNSENIKYFYEDELQEIFEKASDSERIIYRLLYETAGRVNEVLNLKFKDIFYDKRKKINIVKVKNLKQRNEKATKEVLISDNLKNEIEEFRKEHNLCDDDYICNNYHFVKKTKITKIKKMTDRTLNRHLIRIVEEINADNYNDINISRDKVHTHTFRHTRAINMLDAGADLEYVRRLLGHKNIANTAIYLKYASSKFFEKTVEFNKKLGL